MDIQRKRGLSGFTLVELAIVLGVAGFLFGGIWTLISSGNQQTRDRAAANEISELIGTLESYFQTEAGQKILSDMGGGAKRVIDVSTLVGTSAVPSGFTNTNAYGQLYRVGILTGSVAATGGVPQTYSFMVLTVGGDVIPDTSGGRIAAMIGGDGGFIYTTATCGATPDRACGSFGAWSVAVSDYGFSTSGANPASVGHIATRTVHSPATLGSVNPWLARLDVSDTSLNTMFTSLFLGAQQMFFDKPASVPAVPANTTGKGILNAQGGMINMGLLGDDTSGSGSTINLQKGTVNVQGGLIDIGSTGSISGAAGTGGNTLLTLSTTGGGAKSKSVNPVMNIVGGCVPESPEEDEIRNVCNYTVTVNGGMSVSGMLFANKLFAGEFVYYSDERLKKDIKPLKDSLTSIMRLNPVSFTFKETGKESMGLIAQEVEKVYPEVVTEDPTGYKAVGYDALISPLVSAVQELKKENDLLKEQLREQNARQEKLKEDIDALKRIKTAH